MKMKLKAINGMVSYLMECGKDKVSGEMPLSSAKRICSHGTTISKRFRDYPICVDGKFFFAGVEIEKPITEEKE